MRYLCGRIGAWLLILALCGCTGHATITEAIYDRAKCACINDGGIEWIEIRTSTMGAGDATFNFQCVGGLETGWVSYTGSWMFAMEDCYKVRLDNPIKAEAEE